MIKFKKKMKYLKGFILYALLCVFAFMPFMSFNVNAWSENDDGNLVSDNILTFDDGSYNGLGVNYVCVDNKITLNGTATSSGPLWVNISIPSGSYVFQTFNDFTYNDGFRLTLRSGYGTIKSSCSYNVQNSYSVFTSDTTIDILAISVVSGVSYNNVVLTPSLVVGSTPLNDYEPYGAIYYSQDNYNNVYDDAYSNGYDDATQNIVDGLQLFNALELYYNSAYLFISTDGGSTWSNTSGQNYNVSYSSTFDALRVERSADWNANALYYLDISFKSPININSLRIPASNHPQTLQKVVVGDSEYNFTYSYVDGVSYFLTKEMLSGLTTSIKLYFGINSTTSNGSRFFYVYVDGFLTGIDNYNNGYKDGKASLQPTIDNLNENINILKTQVDNLTLQLQQGNSSWYSLFFAMADTPFKTASNFLGFEIFGVNLFNALIGFITILAIFWVFKRLIK